MQLLIGLYFTFFISIAVLRLGLNGSVDSDAVLNFLLHCRKIETISKSSGQGPHRGGGKRDSLQEKKKR